LCTVFSGTSDNRPRDARNVSKSSTVELNVSRQAVIKALVRQALDQRYSAQGARKAG
jgi:hypothetical protein